MKFKKQLFMFVSIALIFSMCIGFAGCSGNENPTDTPAPSGSGSEAASESSSQITNNNTSTSSNSTESEDALLKKEHDVTKYDVTKFTAPIWSGDICYAEAAFVMENEDGVVEPIKLLYPIEKIISVKNAKLNITYEEGKDYRVNADGNLEILSSGRITAWKYETLYFSLDYADSQGMSTNNGYWWWADHPNQVIIHKEVGNNLGMLGGTIAVTYQHSGESVVTAPETARYDYFEDGLIQKLEAGETVNVVSMGDSITDGWSSTGKVNATPNTPAYNNMVVDYMEENYPNATIRHTNIAVSGSGVRDGAGEVKLQQMCNANPDLVIIAYGMNDAGLTASEFVTNINIILDELEAKCPNAMAVVVSTCFPNPEMSWTNGGPSMIIGKGNDNFPMAFSAALKQASLSWYNAAFADVASVNNEMYERKSHFDLTGSNSNHPNDYMHRVYAQVVIQTIFGTLN